jgi:hypothetical protein
LRCFAGFAIVAMVCCSALGQEELTWPGNASIEPLLSTPVDNGVEPFELPPEQLPAELSDPFSRVRWYNPESWLSPLEVFPATIYGFTVADSWRGPSDGHFQNNNGFKKGITLGSYLPGMAEHGIAGQIGGSYALYDEAGRYSTASDRVQQQGFVTAGIFRRGNADSPVSAGIVYDSMFNDAFGVFAQDPYLSQLRVQAGLLLSEEDEVGFWCALPMNTAHKSVGGLDTTWRGVAQYNVFWHRNFQPSCADLWLWIGVPTDDRPSGSLGQFILGSYGSVPINEQMQMYAVASYMAPSASLSPAASTEDSFYVGFGIAVFVGPKARRTSVGGNPQEPYLPVADNGTFFVDTNRIQ